MHGRPRKVDVSLPEKGNSNSHGARPVHLIITMIKWIRTSRLLIKNPLSACAFQWSRTPTCTCILFPTIFFPTVSSSDAFSAENVTRPGPGCLETSFLPPAPLKPHRSFEPLKPHRSFEPSKPHRSLTNSCPATCTRVSGDVVRHHSNGCREHV